MDYRYRYQAVTMKRALIIFLLFSYFTGRAQHACYSYEYMQSQMANEPGLKEKLARMDAEWQSRGRGEVLTGVEGGSSNMQVIRIPVVVHILYRDVSENISDDQVKSQIEALNKAFRKTHADTALTPDVFKPFSADCFIEFALAQSDPAGFATTGIVRKKTSIYGFNVDDRIKHSDLGGDDAWDADRYLNIWVGNTAGGIIGYSSVPGCNKDVDGIVIRFNAFGTMGKATAPYNLGRTAVHEIGHWLGLRHIWGDSYCGNDGINDTPPQRSGTNGCPSGIIISCENGPYGNMYMNYMDITYDACTNLFTRNQRDRMRSLFDEGGPRNAILSSPALLPGVAQSPLPEDSSLENSFLLYPNPARESVKLVISSKDLEEGECLIRFYNHIGQLVLSQQATETTTFISLRQLPDGIYYVRIGNTTKPQKLIKTVASFSF